MYKTSTLSKNQSISEGWKGMYPEMGLNSKELFELSILPQHHGHDSEYNLQININ